jgi:hypothetical protein
MSSDLFQQGVEAFQAGDKARTKQIMLEVTAADPNNDNAWYYLAAAESNRTKRREYLKRVLQINPNHERAREVLAKLDERAGGTPAAATPAAATPAAPPPEPPRSTPIRPLDPAAGDTPGGDAAGTIVLPVSIPGAPAQVSPQSLLNGGLALFRTALDVLMGKTGVYDAESGRATWWRFWLLVGFGFVITAALSFISTLILQIQLSSIGLRFNLIGVIISLLLTAPISAFILYVGIYASHWWAKRQGGQAPLYQHAYTVALPYVPAMVIGGVLRVVFSLFLASIASLVSLALSIYALYLIALQFEKLYAFSDSNQKWFTVGAMFVGYLIAGFVMVAVFGTLFGAGAFSLF